MCYCSHNVPPRERVEASRCPTVRNTNHGRGIDAARATTTTPRKAGSHESQSTTTKKCLSLLERNSSQRDTALCSAVLAQSGTYAMVPLIPWPAVGRPSESAGASQHAKKLHKNTLDFYNTFKKTKNIPTFFVESQYHMYDDSAGSARALRWRMRQWTPRDTDAMKSLMRVHHCPQHAPRKQTPAVLQAATLTALHMDEANRWPW